MINLMTIKEVYFEIEKKIEHLNRFEKSNFVRAVYKKMKSEYNIDLKGRATIYSKKDTKDNILEPYYYFLANQEELDIFENLCYESLSQTPKTETETKTEYTKSDSDANIYMLVKIINKISSIYNNLNQEAKNDFEKKLLKNLTIEKCNVYQRQAKDIEDIKPYIQSHNSFILNLSCRFDIGDIQGIIKAMQKTKEELKIA